ncbi:RTA1 like protein-domain-containing protein [Dactylonectria macrodidyma]|uniref:RTA1 like protein-domain-containing protein n=1 Tax=Dactylonectria macrodidyma TaxID=307937 RepID=A0A9P9E3E1_9HYPO|nr:RTA1 like protein-domain-containing protein [Dactylonectria macrodidyma]
MAELKPVDGSDVYLWKYLPSIPAACVFLILFTLITAAHTWRMVKTRAWFTSVFAIGGLFQIIGYAVRIISHYYTNEIAPYVIQISFILLAPVFYAASIYMVLGRLVLSVHGERCSIIRPTRMTKIFVAGDILSLTLQGNAAGLTAKASTQKIGEAIIVSGLFVQLVVFGFFVVVAMIFHRRMGRQVAKQPEFTTNVPWRQGLSMLYACSALIMVRSIFRVVEYLMGVDGYLLINEWPMYAFDSVLMLAVQIIFLIWFPNKFSQDGGHDFEEAELMVR